MHRGFYGPAVDSNGDFAKGEMDGACSSASCTNGRFKPKASFFDTIQKRWVCYECAREQNLRAYRLGTKKRCISGQEYVYKLLSE